VLHQPDKLGRLPGGDGVGAFQEAGEFIQAGGDAFAIAVEPT
jgi:hypothetical protein